MVSCAYIAGKLRNEKNKPMNNLYITMSDGVIPLGIVVALSRNQSLTLVKEYRSEGVREGRDITVL